MICNTLIRIEPDGHKVYKEKKPYNTLDEAILAAKNKNAMDSTIQKLFAYKCTYCYKYHIGRNGKLLTKKDREKYKKELGIGIKIVGKINLETGESIGPKIVGWVDLNKFK